MEPIRIQRKRVKGWSMPEDTVSVSRQSKWGNPFKVGDKSPQNHNVTIDAEHAVQLFKLYLEGKEEAGTLRDYLKPLKGKNLACFCKPGAHCHADILLQLANAD